MAGIGEVCSLPTIKFHQQKRTHRADTKKSKGERQEYPDRPVFEQLLPTSAFNRKTQPHAGNHEENWDVVSSFLKLQKEFHLEPAQNFVPNEWINRNQCLETFPPKHNVDGMFAARLRKIC